MTFERGTVERAARDALAERLDPGGARDPYAVATARVTQWDRTEEGRDRILRLAAERVDRGPEAFGGEDPAEDWRLTRRSLRRYRRRRRRGPSRFMRRVFRRIRGRA